jgi:hypothetical protein
MDTKSQKASMIAAVVEKTQRNIEGVQDAAVKILMSGFQHKQVKRKSWFRLHDSCALGTELLADCFSFMLTPEQYRAFAEECERLAKQTEDEHYRKALREMAKEWIKLVEADEED